MTTNEQTPHEKFDELLDALWAGELDRDGEAMLEALAAGDPELAERLRRERSITSKLAAKGPNRAPEGLAAAVFARLDEQPAATVIQVKQRRSWFFTPQLRWGLAAAALVVVGIQGMWIVYHERPAGADRPMSYPTAELAQAELTNAASPAVNVKTEKSAKPRRTKQVERQMAAVHPPQPTATPKAVQEEIELAMAQSAATNIEDQAVKPSPAPTPEPPKPSQVNATPEPQPEQPAMAAAEPKPSLPVIAPGTGAWHAKPSRFETKPEERVIAAAAPATHDSAQQGLVMRIEMSAAQASAEPAQPAQPAPVFERNKMVRAFAPAEPQRAVPMTSFAPQRGGSSVRIEEPRPAAAPAAVSPEQIEQAITAAGGTVKGVRQTRINPPSYKIDATIPHSNLPAFVERLNQMGIKSANAEGANYTVLEGEELLTKTSLTTPTQQRAATQVPLTILFDR